MHIPSFGILLSSTFVVAFVCGASAQGSKSPETYEPPAASKVVLGNIVPTLKNAKPVDISQFEKRPPKVALALPGGQLYFEVPSIDIDDDGSNAGSPQGWNPHPVRGGKVDKSHQDITAYNGAKPLSAFTDPYVVLPGRKTPKGADWYAALGLGIHLGDGAVVIRGDKLVFVVFGDTGPWNKIGEMSIKAHELFGENVFEQVTVPVVGPDGKPLVDSTTGKPLTKTEVRTRNRASNGPLIVIVFPHTSVGSKFVSVDTSLKTLISEEYTKLAGVTK